MIGDFIEDNFITIVIILAIIVGFCTIAERTINREIHEAERIELLEAIKGCNKESKLPQ